MGVGPNEITRVLTRRRQEGQRKRLEDTMPLALMMEDGGHKPRNEGSL